MSAKQSDMHSCSYYCDRPDCVRQQRDELRDRLDVLNGSADEIERLREFVAWCATTAGCEVNGNRLSERAKALLHNDPVKPGREATSA